MKEGAAWALSYLARHTPDLAQTVIDSGGIPYLVRCVDEPVPTLQRTAVQCLIDISRHCSEQAAEVAGHGAIPLVAKQLTSADAKLRRAAVQFLATMCKHHDERGNTLAEQVVMADVFASKPTAPRVPPLLADADEAVARNAAVMIRETLKFSAELCRIFVSYGHLPALVSFVSESSGQTALAGVMALGHIAAFDADLARAVIDKGGVPPLARVLRAERGACQASAAWALGQIGGHGPLHSQAVTDQDVLIALIDVIERQQPTDDMQLELHDRCKKALKLIICACADCHALYPILSPNAPQNILKHVVGQLARPGMIVENSQNQREFVANRGLQTLLQVEAEPGSELREAITQITRCYSEEMIRYFDPNTPTTLMDSQGYALDSHILRGPMA